MFEIKNQNKGIEDYIGYRFPLSLSTIWRNHLPFNQQAKGHFSIFQFCLNIENSIKREMK